ncbi:MAG TPA: AAA family ATPase [Thermoanaerobaculia bacterium]|nr:AAA family ATPase [Thermoanaerobaculia bacterium]
MLLRFRVSNFRSIKDEQELSMVANSLAGPKGPLVHLEGHGLSMLRVAAIYGANAAGKSNILEALKFMSTAVVGSHRSWRPEGPIPREPFLLDTASRAAPSRFEADFLLDRVRYQYGFRLDSERILEEWLYTYPNRRKRVWFRRDAQTEEPFEFGKTLRGQNQTIASLTRGNSLFLSAAAENNHEMLTPLHSWFSTNLVFNIHDNIFSAASLLPGRKLLILNLLKLANLGIADIEAKEFSKNQIDALAKLFVSIKEFAGINSNVPDNIDFSRVRLIELKHSALGGPSGITLPLEKESQGTRAWLSLAGQLLNVLESGAVLCVDELDRSLHPRLALEVVRIFEDPSRNPKNAQLIFNTQDTTLLGNLLGGPGLRRDQVWFVEKDSTGASHLYPLTDFKPRRDENLERGYLQGRYGAIPFIASAPFAEAEDE